MTDISSSRQLRSSLRRALLLAALVASRTWLFGATLTITNKSPLPGATLGAPYSLALEVVGGAGPYTWSITDDGLPIGLALGSSTGLISGTPTGNIIGGFAVSISVSDAAGDTGTKAFLLVVNAPPVISYDYYLNWTVGSPYSSPFTIASGTPPYALGISSGSLPNGLSLDSGTGVVSGTPTTPGVFTFTLQVTDAAGGVGSKAVTLTINPVAVITTSSLPNATIGTAYSVLLSVTGGTPPFEWFLRTEPPPWLRLSPSGVLAGTPTASGAVDVSLGVIDSASKSGFRDLTLVVNDTGSLTILTASLLPNATVGKQYSQTLSAINGTTPYSWSLTGGALPPGLTLSLAGVLSGAPSGVGTFDCTIQVTEKSGLTATKSFSLSVVPAPLKILTTSLPAATLHTPYSFTMVAAGGTPPYQWFVSGASLASGLTLDSSTGVISGSPTYAITSGFGILVVDNNQVRASVSLTLQVLSTLAVANTLLPNAIKGVPYTYSLTAQGGTTPYSWSISSGSLPLGLTLDPFSGTISGTASYSGTSNFTVYVTDNAAGAVSVPLTITVSGPSDVGGLSCTPATLSPPGMATCTVTLTSAASSGGLSVGLASDNNSVTLPAIVLVAPGHKNATFPLNVGAITTDQVAVITASAGTSKAVFSLSIAGGPSKLTSLDCVPATIAAGAKSACTVSLSKPPSVALAVSVSADDAILKVPSALIVNPSQFSSPFQAAAGATLSKQIVMVKASSSSGSAETAVTVLPTSSEAPLILAPDSVDAIISAQVQFTVSASDPRGLPVVLSATNLPQGASFAATDGLFLWSPNVAQTGIFNVTFTARNSAQLTGSKSVAIRIMAAAPVNSSPLRFVPVTPCRVADTRNANGLFGGPAISGQNSRDFVIPNSACRVPSTAAAYSLSVAVIPRGGLAYLTVWPTGETRPLVATLNSLDGRIKSNAAIVSAGVNGAISVFATDTTDVALDLNGYFVSGSDPTARAFYTLAPCRIADTRNSLGLLGAPSLSAQDTRSFPIQDACGVPADAEAYSLNFTAVPKVALGFLTAWPAGQAQPLVASLNAVTGAITANAVILPAGANGEVNVFTTDDTDLVIDINGYFAPQVTRGLSLYALTPCRVLDTRLPSGSPPFSGRRDVNVSAAGCGVPGTAQAFVFNASVVPSASLGYITMWSGGTTQPLVATLSAVDGTITSNMAIVPSTDGSISVFSSDPTHLVLDIFGYFAP